MGTAVALFEDAAGPHAARSCAAYAAFSVGSAAAAVVELPRRAAKALQWPTPIVCAPAIGSGAKY
jgi:hypothetical protein